MLQSIKFVFNEHKNNSKLITKLAIINMGKQTTRTSLGVLWVYIHDIVYFSVFVLFRMLMSGSGEIEGINNVVYLMTGLIPWFYMSEVLNVGSHSIKNSKSVITSIKFPISIIPTIEVVSIFLKRIFTFLLIFLVITVYGYIDKFNFFLFIYYIICMVILMWTINSVVSPFVAISADFTQIYLAINRVLMYSLPIIWSFEKITNHKLLVIILKLNPMVYVLQGFRNAFVLGNYPDLLYTIYFGTIVCTIGVIGCLVQYRLKKYYADFM